MTITAQRTNTTLHLPAGMVGFPESTQYTLTEIEHGVYEMLSVDDEAFGFVVIQPEPYFPDYTPVIDTATAERLELTRAQDALLLVVVNIGADGQPPAANLLAPIVVNTQTRTATQVVLADQAWPLRGTIPLD